MLLEVKSLSKSFGTTIAVQEVSFSIESGEAYGLLGPNGAGKSTTISMIFGLVKADSGDVSVDGYSLKKNPLEVKKRLGYVPQEIALNGELSARENLVFWGKLYGLHGKTLQLRIAKVLEIVGLAEREKGHISTFSGGMKRRINIASALMHDPKILIMDEPTVGIDPQSRHHILETVQALNKEGMTIIYTSHYMEEVEFLCTRLGIIDHGQIIAQGTVDELRHIISEKSELRLKISGDPVPLIQQIEILPVVSRAYSEENLLHIITPTPAEALAKIAEIIALQKRSLQEVSIHEPNLEAVFLHLTGRALRD